MRDLKAELELMNEKNPPMRTNFDYRDMVQRCLKAEAEVERLRGQAKKDNPIPAADLNTSKSRGLELEREHDALKGGAD